MRRAQRSLRGVTAGNRPGDPLKPDRMVHEDRLKRHPEATTDKPSAIVQACPHGRTVAMIKRNVASGEVDFA